MNVKEDYQHQMEAKMKEWGAKLEELKAKADGAQAETKIRIKKEINALSEKQDAVKAKLEQLKDAGEDSWENLKSGVEKAFDDISHSLNSSKSKKR